MAKAEIRGAFKLLSAEKRESFKNLLANSELEIFPSNNRDFTHQLTGNHPVAITCSPSYGIEGVIKLAEALRARNIVVTPHIAARSVHSFDQIDDGLSDRAFIIGGDSQKPAGGFDSAISLMQAMAVHDILPKSIGVAGYPEPHPHISDEVLLEALHSKQEFAESTDIDMYIVTQMCFDAGRIINWIKDIRGKGINLPVIVGVPGPCDVRKLARFAKVCGVGDSARLLSSKSTFTRKLTSKALFGYQPDDLLVDLINLDSPEVHVSGVRLYTFNNVSESNKFIHQMQTGLE